LWNQLPIIFSQGVTWGLFLNTLCRRKVIVECPITLSNFSSNLFFFIPPIFNTQGCFYFTSSPPTIYVDLVREFYANISGYQAKTSYLTTYIGGIGISITRDSFAKNIGIPFEPHPDFPYPKDSTPSPANLGALFRDVP
jgi:hypothetical protein